MIFLEIEALNNICRAVWGVQLLFVPTKYRFQLKKKCISFMEVKIKEIARKLLQDQNQRQLLPAGDSKVVFIYIKTI